MQYFLGIDVGGTHIKAVLLKEAAESYFSKAFLKKITLRTLKMNTEARKGKKRVIANMLKAAGIISEGKKISGIGISLAGSLDPGKKYLARAPNLHCLEKTEIKKIFEKEFRVPALLENDAKAAAFAESKLLPKSGEKTIVLVAIGTGIGGGILINGQLLPGATEPGHMMINPQGYKCACGNKGCLEASANARFIERRAKELRKSQKTIMKKFDPLSVQKAAEKGDAVAKRVYSELAQNLGIGLANICNILSPNIILLSGGIANARMIYPIARKKITELALKQNAEKLVLKKAKAGYFAGAIGAALLAMEEKS